MADQSSESVYSATGLGGLAVIGGVVCCLGLKLIGGAFLFSGLAAAIGLSTDQTTFLVGGSIGVGAAVVFLGYRRSGELE